MDKIFYQERSFTCLVIDSMRYLLTYFFVETVYLVIADKYFILTYLARAVFCALTCNKESLPAGQ